jgi:hypothetical protein
VHRDGHRVGKNDAARRIHNDSAIGKLLELGSAAFVESPRRMAKFQMGIGGHVGGKSVDAAAFLGGDESVLTMPRALLIEAAMYRKNLRHRHDAANPLNEALSENMQHSCLERR